MSAKNNICEHCKKEFTTKGSLVRHQLTAKYCAKSRNLEVEQKFQCPYCEYGAYFKADLNKHVVKCSAKNGNLLEEKEIDRLKKELSERDKELLIRDAKIEVLEKIVERPNVSINNTNNTNITLNTLISYSMQILSPYEELLEKLPKLVSEHVTYDKYRKNIHGITSALIEGILQNEDQKWIVCYEGSKQDFHEKRLGQIEIDQRASDFFKNFINALKPKIEEFSRKELYEACSDEAKMNAHERKRRITKLYDPSSVERKTCVKNIADAIYLSKNSVRIRGSDQSDNLDARPVKITNKMRMEFLQSRLPEYYDGKSQIYNKMQIEFTVGRFLQGIPGLVDAAKNALIFDGKLLVLFSNSEFWINVKNDVQSILVGSLIKELTGSLIRLCSNHVEDYLEKFPDQDIQVRSLQMMFREIKNVQFSEGKEIFTPEWQKFADLLAESLILSDDEIAAKM